MEISDIESKISAARSRIRALKDETKSCMWFDGAGAMKISDPKRLEALNSEIKRLEGLIEHDTPILARLRSIVGDRSVSEVLDSKKIQFAENRVLGIRAELDHALKLQVAADKQISELRKTITERGALRGLVNGTLTEFKVEAL